MTDREQFEDRWLNEQSRSQTQTNKEREFMIYACGWEDGVRIYIYEMYEKSRLEVTE